MGGLAWGGIVIGGGGLAWGRLAFGVLGWRGLAPPLGRTLESPALGGGLLLDGLSRVALVPAFAVGHADTLAVRLAGVVERVGELFLGAGRALK
jgi:hypothetical protein